VALTQQQDFYPHADKNIVLLVGGVGGAKLAYGLYQIHPPEKLTIIVNTGDDMWHYGLRISPDVDTLLYTLSERVDKQNGWGIAGDTITTLQALQQLGEKTWFRLGDIDIATHLLRTHLLRENWRYTDIINHLRQAQNIACRVLPMTDSEVATIVHTQELGALEFQEYFVKHRWQPTIKTLHYRGANEAFLTPEIQTALHQADAIILGPSNPWLSIAPMLNIPDFQQTLRTLKQNIPVLAVTPIVGGTALKGPAAKIMRELGLQVTPQTVVDFYEQIINAFVSDEQDGAFSHKDIQIHAMNTVMKDDEAKITLAEAILNWAFKLEI
jgi:LPPG:FO 2-phospho-L-lactate transferase